MKNISQIMQGVRERQPDTPWNYCDAFQMKDGEILYFYQLRTDDLEDAAKEIVQMMRGRAVDIAICVCENGELDTLSYVLFTQLIAANPDNAAARMVLRREDDGLCFREFGSCI